MVLLQHVAAESINPFESFRHGDRFHCTDQSNLCEERALSVALPFACYITTSPLFSMDAGAAATVFAYNDKQ